MPTETNIKKLDLHILTQAQYDALLEKNPNAFYYISDPIRYEVKSSELITLPTSGAPLQNNAEYRVSTPIGTYTFAWPASPFEVWLRFITASTFNITFPAGTKYITGAPSLKASTQYEMSVKDGVVIIQEVVAE